MLATLQECLLALPPLLEDRSRWNSLIVNRRKPYTYRVFTQLDGVRICLHQFDPCHTHEAFSHPHPWPGAFVILQGKYKMRVGYSQDRVSPPSEVLTLVLSKGGVYEITNPLTWHSVVPLTTTYMVMVNGEPWDTATTAHNDVRTTKGKDLDTMPEEDLQRHLNVFRGLVVDYLANA